MKEEAEERVVREPGGRDGQRQSLHPREKFHFLLNGAIGSYKSGACGGLGEQDITSK